MGKTKGFPGFYDQWPGEIFFKIVLLARRIFFRSKNLLSGHRFFLISSVPSGETILPREKYGKPKTRGVLGKGIQPGYNAHTKQRLGGSGVVSSVPTGGSKTLGNRAAGIISSI